MIDRSRLLAILEAIGDRLRQPARLCVFGSSPAILEGQNERQTQDIDVWQPGSDFDRGDLAQACTAAGVLFDPVDELDPESIYMQVVRPGVVALPADLRPETIGRFGQLILTMPDPSIIAAAKLVRGTDRDLADVVWWVRQRAMTSADVEHAIGLLPRASDREAARENIVIMQLAERRER